MGVRPGNAGPQEKGIAASIAPGSMRKRHSQQRRKRVTSDWPTDATEAANVAGLARYVGSSEHKGTWSAQFEPKLRSDASECPEDLSADPESNSDRLRAAIRAGCVSPDFQEGFPKYVWVWIRGELWEARHIRGPSGTYKAYGPLDAIEYPRDPTGRLDRARALDGVA